MGFQDEVVNIIRQVMPTGAEIQVVSSAFDLDVDVFWKLNDDPKRPNKMSKIILIHVTHAAVRDYIDASVRSQANACRRINSFLSQKLANFDPKHNVPKHASPPIEQWFIDTNLLFG